MSTDASEVMEVEIQRERRRGWGLEGRCQRSRSRQGVRRERAVMEMMSRGLFRDMNCAARAAARRKDVS